MFVLFVCLCIHINSFAQNTIYLNNLDGLMWVGKKMMVLEDKTSTLAISDITKPQYQQTFKPLPKNIFSHPVSTSAFWFKIIIENKSNKDVWLSIADTRLKYIDFYTPKIDGTYSSPLLLGASRPQQNRVFPSAFYCVPIHQHLSPQTYYLRVKGSLNLLLPFKVGTTQSLIKKFDTYDQILNIFIGLVLSMLVYNLFLFFATHDRLYLIYVSYLAMVFLVTPFSNGQAMFFYSWFWDNFLVWQSPLFWTITLFVDLYLNLKQHAPKLKRWLWALTICLGVFFPLLNLLGIHMTYYLKFFQLTVLVYSFSLLICGVYLWLKGHKNARFYILGWSSVIIASFVYLFTSNGLLPLNTFTRQSLYFGFGLEALMFSLALGDRLNILKKEKDEALAQNLQLITNQKEALEHKVKERTLEIQEQNEEMEAQNQMMKATHQELQETYQEINKKNENLLASINYAKTIQNALLSLRKGVINALGADNFFILFKPRDIVSGDFHYIEVLEDERLLLAAIDCTGHGIPGAFMSMIGYEVMTEIVKVRKETKPNTILELLHRYIASVLKQSETNNKDGMDAALVVIDKQKHLMEFAGAKNPLVYIQNEQLTLIKGDKRSIGGQVRQLKEFRCHQVDISTPTIFYLFSDGYQDQFGGEENKKFMLARLKNLLMDVHLKEMEEQQKILDTTLEQWMQQGNETQIDDVLVMGVKV
ncbi:7TM diverse intracellular signaling domain-containing protein [uncultured Microscilla sp.]|uniref:7TM diverse intracellular signaling domain-containing protein n=1 Tax=uncultured Microscilla sp. TaxID=432653 RepID=UPI002627607D|nr:7TM diverse intracellular signaling domain-containing protein [uncultured Microscilla sp.]